MEKKIAFTVSNGEESWNLEGFDFVIAVGLKDCGEENECTVKFEGRAGTQDIADCIESIYDSLGSKKKSEVMLCAALRSMGKIMGAIDKEEDDGE